MDDLDAKTELETAISVARNALEDWKVDPTPAKFRVWRDASELAIKWHRACRLGAGGESGDKDELDAILRG